MSTILFEYKTSPSVEILKIISSTHLRGHALIPTFHMSCDCGGGCRGDGGDWSQFVRRCAQTAVSTVSGSATQLPSSMRVRQDPHDMPGIHSVQWLSAFVVWFSMQAGLIVQSNGF